MIPVFQSPVSIPIKLFLLIITFSQPLISSEYWEYEEEPALQNNFAEARFRLWLPPAKAPFKGVLFLALGTDSNGLHLAADSNWQKLATELHYGLVSCHLRGEGESYEIARNGSGQALLNALVDFSKQTKRPELAGAPLILWGHSAGGQFAYQFACWNPKRVLGFISIKWASYSGPPDKLTYRVPALIIAGEHDESGRNQSLAQVFEYGRAESAPWAFLLEKNAGHGLDQTNRLSLPFIQALAKGNKTQPFALDIGSGRIQPHRLSESADLRIGWLPNRDTATQWQNLHKRCDLEILKNPPTVHQPSPDMIITPSMLDWGKIPSDSTPVTRRIEVTLSNHDPQDSVVFNIRDTRIESASVPMVKGFRINITLNPQNLPIGPYRSQGFVQYNTKGKKQQSAELSLYGMITSDVAAQPASLYLGVLPRKSQASFKLKIHSSSKDLQLLKASSPEPDWIQPKLLTSTPGILEFDCTIQTGDRIGRRYGELRFRVKTDQEKEIVVPYIGFVKKS